MPTLRELIPDVRVMLALAPEELAFQLLKLAKVHAQQTGQVHSQSVLTAGGYAEQNPEIELAITEAWKWLELNMFLLPAPGANGRNGWNVLGRRAQKALTQEQFADYRKAACFPRELLHPAIAEIVWPALARGDFDVAVLYAFRTVEEAVRSAGGFKATDLGVDLMRRAFAADSGPLTDRGEPRAEQEALGHLFAGAIGSYKNPRSHRTVAIRDPLEAEEMVMLASHLLRIVDSRRSVSGAP